MQQVAHNGKDNMTHSYIHCVLIIWLPTAQITVLTGGSLSVYIVYI